MSDLVRDTDLVAEQLARIAEDHRYAAEYLADYDIPECASVATTVSSVPALLAFAREVLKPHYPVVDTDHTFWRPTGPTGASAPPIKPPSDTSPEGTMSDTHVCPGGCGRDVPDRLFACRDCWFRLPADLRTPITQAYRTDPSAHFRAKLDAIGWFRDNLSHRRRP